MSSNAVPPSVTPPSPFEWPQDLIKPITGIANGMNATVTCVGHGFTTQNQGITFLMFKQVEGMIQINGLNCLIQKIIDVDTFTVNIDSTNFYQYTGGGVIIVDSSIPPISRQGFQYFNTPFQNIANQG